MSELEVRIVELDPMCVASFRAVGARPEVDAWGKLRAWAGPRGLLDDAGKHPVFGFNNPSPSPDCSAYGYELWISVDAAAEAVGDAEIKSFPGGRYAVTTCRLQGDPRGSVFDVWQQLWQWVQASEYTWRKTHELEKVQDPGASEQDVVLELHLPIEG